MAIDNQNNLYASGTSHISNQADTPYLAVYNNSWQPLTYANGGAITYNGSNLFSVPFPNNGITYNLEKLVNNSSQWLTIGNVLPPYDDCGLDSSGLDLSSDQFGNIYANMNAYCIKGGNSPLTSLIYSKS